MPDEKIPVEDVCKSLEVGRHFERLQLLKGDTYRDKSTVIAIPTLGMMPHRFVNALLGMIAPQNQKRAIVIIKGDEVGTAYNKAIDLILSDKDMASLKYVMTIEDDNIVPSNAHIKLLQAIEETGWDAISGLYFSKQEFGFPMALGNPELFRNDGVLDFVPRDVREAVAKGEVMEVNGIAMGCALWKLDLFREIEKPWFKTWLEVSNGNEVHGQTQDLYFCERMRRAGKRIGVDCRVKVGHLCTRTEILW